MITGVVTVGLSSSYSKVCIAQEQRDAVSVVVRLKELSHLPLFNSEEADFTARITAGTVGKTIIQYRRTLWTRIWLKKHISKINFGKSKY